MIYYQLSGFEGHDGPEIYLPDEEGPTCFYYVKFSKQQPVEKLKLIFIDMYKAEYSNYSVNIDRIHFFDFVKSNTPMEVIKTDDP